ncbi:MAG: AsmA-like C-terminal domain-containing protein, partial [Desulfobacterales bacterium]
LSMVISPRLINLEMVRRQIKDRIWRNIGAEIKYREIVLAYFPRPHVVIHKAELRIPDSFTIKAHRMRFYPKIGALLRGQLQVSSVRLEYADYFMILPKIDKTAPHPDEIVATDSILKAVARAVRGLPEFNLPDIKFTVKYGKVNLVDPYGRKFKLREVQAEYHSHPDSLDFAIQCKSNLWDQIEINGFLDPKDFQGRGKINLSRLRPQTLLAYLMPESRLQVTDARASLRIDFELQGAGNLKAEFDGAIPFLALDHGRQKLTFNGGRFQGTIGIGGGSMKVNLTELGIDEPQLSATGMFSYDEDQHDVRLAINGTEINADSVREMALALAGESDIIRNIFYIIRGGYVPWMNVEVQGHSITDLGNLDNIVIKGKLVRGNIFIPGAELDLEDVIGHAIIAEGILNGDNLQARMGKTRGLNGTLKLGLNEAIAPLKLKISINADLAQLPPVLNRIIDEGNFIRELARIGDVKGSASGVLMLGDDLDSLAATVHVTKAKLSARYDRLPYPIHLEGGQFVYDGYRIAADRFDARIGNSYFKQFAAAINWAAAPTLDFKTKSATLDLEEVYAWLTASEKYETDLAYIRSLDGMAAVTQLTVKGPLFAPRSWQFTSRGRLSKIRVSSHQLPQVLNIDQGQFSCTQSALNFKAIEGTLGKSTISQLSANFELNANPAFDIKSKSVNLVAEEIYPWLLSKERLKPALEDFKVTSGNLILNDLTVNGPVHQPDRWQYQADGDMQNLSVDSDAFAGIVTINQGAFELATESITDDRLKKIKFDPTNLTWRDSRLVLSGEMGINGNDIILDSRISADRIDWSQVSRLLDYIKKKKSNPDSSYRDGGVLGTLKVLSDKLNYDSYSVQPLQTEISFKPEKIIIAIQQASVCSINLRGLLNVYEQSLEIYLVPTAVDQNLVTAASCITGQKEIATGTFSLSGELLSKSKSNAFVQSLTGNLAFSAKEGRIYRLGLLAKILSILNVTEIYRGEIPDLTGEGFAYRSMTANAKIKDGKLIMQECSIDGVSMGLACDGNINFVEKKMDLTVLVAPFKTIDRIVDIIPLVGHVLGGTLVSIPFEAKGDLQ